MTNRPLKVFLCHSSNDKPAVRELYRKLRAEPWIEPWLDEEDIFPGDDWNLEIQKSIRETDAIIVCLSKGSITKEGYVQREIKTALDYSDEKPERTVYIIPIRLEECKPPERLSKWQYADYFEGNRERALQRLLVSLKRRAESLGLQAEAPTAQAESAPKPVEKKPIAEAPKVELSAQPSITNQPITNKLTLSNGMEFMRVPAGEFLMGKDEEEHTVNIPYDYWMGRFLVTNEQFNEYVKSKDTAHPVENSEKKKDHPVINVNWHTATDYCNWLNDLMKKELPPRFTLRLPSEGEWEKAARGTDGRVYAWGNTFDEIKCNTDESIQGGTTPVGMYSPYGDSPYGCADMTGNVWEWTSSIRKPYPFDVKNVVFESDQRMGLRGGSWKSSGVYAAPVAVKIYDFPDFRDRDLGFRVIAQFLPSG